jgi:nucleoside-diphosphate-sugar epimerase
LRILVTGAGGFIGSHLVRAIGDAGHEVVAWMGRNAKVGTLAAADKKNIVAVWGDLGKEISVPMPVDAIVHAAATSWAPGVSVADMASDNVGTTKNLVNFAVRNGIGKFILLSSLSVLGDITTRSVNSETPINNPDPYGTTKLLAEMLVAEHNDTFASLAIRLPGVIGPNSVRNWLTTVMNAARCGGRFSYFNPDAPFNNAVHVNDLATFVCELLTRQWQGHVAIAVGARDTMPIRDVINEVFSAFGDPGLLDLIDPLKPAFVIDSSHARSNFGYAPMGISDMISRFIAENQS